MTVPMTNVIRPKFGSRVKLVPSASAASIASDKKRVPLRIYGSAAGHVVALFADDAAPEGPLLKVVVGAEAGETVETVAILPATPEGEADADMAAMAALRTLEVVEAAERLPVG